ncbi:AbrB/MazE/SpoVT family DNA-binding domain-containing protein [Candidatus Poribacteria bacterium]|nr:AbrB/MazE/SpoVT family DNA-binding domain-containing protein [Candidatus Poribacteria bacterium]
MSLIRALLKVDENGQITIPKNVVKALNINPGQHAELRLLPRNKIQLTPQEKWRPKKQ